ncbi:MAG: hypothetical protein ETSY1_04015 [Candidatus Entotheonella factor]|uniref:Methyltransferase domain-containing protein n=2 Tax=Candidatus Entotheonella TaxID=93171 RepID=W4LX54_ENTF1|nr:MAG: hypothetical protein ETSY1_04015 [Candidatus Entotheonella factor]
MRFGASFEDQDVVKRYIHRAPYPDEVFCKIVDLAPERRSMLDLGCGPGTIARRLASQFERLTALDASRAMLDLGRQLPNGKAANIHWMEGLAEHVTYVGYPYDIIVAAESIHWMDHQYLFPKLCNLVTDAHIFAVVEGDEACQPPWQTEWEAFLARWIRYATHRPYQPVGHEPFLRRYEEWVEVLGEQYFISKPIVQDVDHFIACQHSRNTFAPSALGSAMTAFDRELAELLGPYATENKIEYIVKTRVTWGKIQVNTL